MKLKKELKYFLGATIPVFLVITLSSSLYVAAIERRKKIESETETLIKNAFLKWEEKKTKNSEKLLKAQQELIELEKQLLQKTQLSKKNSRKTRAS